MLKHKKMIVVMLTIVLVVLLVGFTMFQQRAKEKYEFSTNDNKSKIEKLDNEISTSTNIADAEKFAKIVQEVENIAKDFKDNDLLSVLMNEELNKDTKQLFLEKADSINAGEGIQDDAKFITVLYDKETEKNIRSYLISKIDFDTEYEKNALKDLVCDENYKVSVRAMDKLQKTDAILALEISDKIILENNESDDVVRAAIMTKSEYFEDMYLSGKSVSKDVKKTYIDFCVKKHNETNDEVLKDAIAFSLINMRDFDAVKVVISNDKIDNDVKKSCISKNTAVIGEVLRNAPSNEDFEFIVYALNILPVYDLNYAFKECITENPEYYNAENKNLLLRLENSNVYADDNRDDKGVTVEWLK